MSSAGALGGRRILVTRAPHQASELAERLRALGAEPILIPTIQIAAPASFCALDAALACMRAFDLVVFTSANAVASFAERARRQGIALTPRRIAVVGSATARAVRDIGLAVDVMPESFTAEALAELLVPKAAGLHVLLVRAEKAPALLPDALEAAGADVTIAAAYSNRVPTDSVAALAQLFSTADRYPDAVTFTSASTAINLFALLAEARIAIPSTVLRASIGPITSRALEGLGQPMQLEAKQSTVASLVEALCDHFETLRVLPERG